MSSTQGLFLSRHVSEQTRFRITFHIPSEQPIDPIRVINFDVYRQLLAVNSDIIDDIYVSEVFDDPNSRYVIMLLKQVSASLGINKKYVVSKVTLSESPTKQWVAMEGTGIPLSQTGLDVPSAYERLDCIHSRLMTCYQPDAKQFLVQYDFAIEDPKLIALGMTLPKAVTDMGALIMKKAFLRMKEFKATEIQNLT